MTNRYDKNSSAETILDEDPGRWPQDLSQYQRQLLIENCLKQVKGLDYPRNKDNKRFSDNF